MSATQRNAKRDRKEVETDKPFGVVPKFVLLDVGLSDGAKVFFAYLCTYADPKGWCHPPFKQAAKHLGVCRKTIQNRRAELEQRGYIVVHQKKHEASDVCVIRIHAKVLALLSSRAAGEDEYSRGAKPVTHPTEKSFAPGEERITTKHTIINTNRLPKGPSDQIRARSGNPTKVFASWLGGGEAAWAACMALDDIGVLDELGLRYQSGQLTKKGFLKFIAENGSTIEHNE